MIHFTDLTDPREPVYTWENPDPPGGVRMWCPDRMVKWCEETNRQIFTSLLDPDRANWFINNRGIEQHRVTKLILDPRLREKPVLMMRMDRNDPAEPHWDLMLDGHHRYVAKVMAGHREFKLYHVTEQEAKQFEVTGFPQPRGRLNIDAYSGL